MGLYIRKSISVGPLRFNFSKSGVGVSAGITGFRVGTGPRGNYVHMGRGGLYYRKTLSSNSKKQNALAEHRNPSQLEENQHGTHAPLEEIESTTVFAMTDSNSAELLDELNSKRKRHRLWPIVLIIGFILTALTSWSLIGFIITALASIAAYYYDLMKKTVVLFYDMDEDVKPLYEALHHAINQIATCKMIWHIEAEGAVYDKKYHAGADALIRRKPTFVGKRQPSFVKTNITVPAISVGKQTLFFFPDRLLVFENNAVGAVSYSDLTLNIYTGNFIEDNSVPKDATIVDRTWKYVNKKGGPDKRFSHNPQIPIVRYGYIDMTSASGLNERLCLSRIDMGDYFKKAIAELCALSMDKKMDNVATVY